MTPEQLMEEILPIINEAANTWRAKNTDAVIAARVNKLLDEHSNDITMKLLGFNSSWGKQWKLDHCNGRSGNSAAGDYIRQTQAVAVKAWLTTAVTALKPMNVKDQASFNNEVKYEYNLQMRACIQELVNKQINLDTDLLIGSLKSTSLLDTYLKTQALLEGTP